LEVIALFSESNGHEAMGEHDGNCSNLESPNFSIRLIDIEDFRALKAAMVASWKRSSLSATMYLL